MEEIDAVQCIFSEELSVERSDGSRTILQYRVKDNVFLTVEVNGE